MPTAKNLTYLRARNQGAILQTLLCGENISKQELSQRLNLTPMSISYITRDLLEKGILSENKSSPIKKDTPGRRGVAISIEKNRLLAISVSVTRLHLHVSLVDLTGDTLMCYSHVHSDNFTAQTLTDTIIEDTEKILEKTIKEHILGIGISCIGLVDIQENTVLSATDFYEIKDWQIGNILQKQFDIPCYVVEDMKAAGLAEQYYGATQGLADFIYLGITYGLGAGVIAGGKLLEGNRGFCGEVGHTTLYHNGKECGCGNRGCAETYLSVGAIIERAGLKDWKEFLDMCEKSPYSTLVESITSDLATLLVNIVNSFDTEAVIIGHEGAMLPSFIFVSLNEEVNRRIIARRAKKVDILPSAISEKIHALNGAAIVFSHLFNGDFKL